MTFYYFVLSLKVSKNSSLLNFLNDETKLMIIIIISFSFINDQKSPKATIFILIPQFRKNYICLCLVIFSSVSFVHNKSFGFIFESLHIPSKFCSFHLLSLPLPHLWFNHISFATCASFCSTCFPIN